MCIAERVCVPPWQGKAFASGSSRSGKRPHFLSPYFTLDMDVLVVGRDISTPCLVFLYL